MSFFQWVYYWLFFGWLFDDGTVTKEDTVDDYCSDESPYRDYGSPSMSDDDNEMSYRGSYGGGSDTSYGSYDSYSSGGSSYGGSDSSYSSSSSSDF